MSRWTLSLMGLILATIPSSAGENPWRSTVEIAPMPRVKHGSITIGFGVSRAGLKSSFEAEEWTATPSGAVVGRHRITPGQALGRILQFTARDEDASQRKVARNEAPSPKPEPKAYVIESPDTLLIDAVLKKSSGTIRGFSPQPISGTFQVGSDGTVSIGIWGSVTVAGLTIDQAKEAVKKCVMKSPFYRDQAASDESLVVLVQVDQTLSKRFYIISGGEKGEQVLPFPLAGRQTVLDVLADAKKLHVLPDLSQSKIHLARPGSGKRAAARILPVDWTAITHRGEAATNYLILAGDRIVVEKSTVQAATPARIVPPSKPGEGLKSIQFMGGTEPFPESITTWYREWSGMVAAIAFKKKELTITIQANESGRVTTATIHADYSVSKDGTIYGVFTAADVEPTGHEPRTLNLVGLSMELQSLVDQPFAIKSRIVDGVLMLSNVRLPGDSAPVRDLMVLLSGRFAKALSGVAPRPKANLARAQIGYCFRPPVLSPACWQLPGNYCPNAVAPAPAYPPSEISLPPIQNFASAPGCPIPPALPPALAPTAASLARPPLPPESKSRLPLGTWVREIGPVRYQLEMTDSRMVATVTVTESEGNETISVDQVLVVDCYPTRKPGEYVGMISGFDLASPSQALGAKDVQALLVKLPGMQKELVGKPVAFSVEKIGDSLILGRVNLPLQMGNEDLFRMTFAALGGRYKDSNGLPSLKPIAMKAVRQIPRTAPSASTILDELNIAPIQRIGVDLRVVPGMPQPQPLPEPVPVQAGRR